MKKIERFVITLFLLIIPLAVFWPLWFMLTGALMPADELRDTIGPVFSAGKNAGAIWPLLPSWPSLQPLTELLLDTPQFFTAFWNTCQLVLPQIAGQVLVSTPAAWAFSRFRFRGRGVLFSLYVFLMLLPFQVMMVPYYLVLDTLNLLDTVWAVILPGVFSTFPVFIMKKNFDGLPKALLEAAALDGAGYLKTFFAIGVPLGAPGIMACVVLGFLEAWSAVEQPMVFLKDAALWPLSLILPQINADNLGLSVAAGLIALMPSLLIFLFGQKYLEIGIEAGMLKE